MTTLRELEQETLAELRALHAVLDDRQRSSPIMRAVAAHLIELREHFVTPDGEVDLAGRSHAYRQTVRELYSLAGFSRDEAMAAQSSVRYHVGELLRERLTADELDSLGLLLAPPTERNRTYRARRSAETQAIRGGDPEGFVGIDALRALEGARALLSRVTPAALSELDRAARTAASGILAGIVRSALDAQEAIAAAPRRR